MNGVFILHCSFYSHIHALLYIFYMYLYTSSLYHIQIRHAFYSMYVVFGYIEPDRNTLDTMLDDYIKNC